MRTRLKKLVGFKALLPMKWETKFGLNFLDWT